MEQQQGSPERSGHHRGRLVVVLAGAMAVLFVVGVFTMFQWRFREGDVYGPGSSLRADPVGGRVFFDSLREIPGLEVERNFETYRKLAGGKGRALLMIGASRSVLDRGRDLTEIEALEAFAEAGGRIAIAMTPDRLSGYEEEERAEKLTAPAAERHAKDRSEAEGESRARERSEWDKEAQEAGSDETDKGTEKEGEPNDAAEEEAEAEKEDEEPTWESLADEWGFSFEWSSENKPREGWEARRTKNLAGLSNRDLPSWHSPVFLEKLGPGWEVLARVEKKPVLARLAMGEGEVVLATDSFFASNEALVNRRATKFLAWFAGESEVVIFDETHLGSELHLNIMQLARRFRLHGFFAGLGLFVILLAWRSSSSLLPGDDELGMGISMRHEVSGEEAAAGFRRLLRRSVGKGELIETCFKAWSDQRGRLARAYPEERLDRARAVVAREKGRSGGKADPARAYNEITEILSEKN